MSFLNEYEDLYVGDDPAKVLRCRLCIWQLIHVPIHIEWNGSIRFGSQATVERAIGQIGHKVRSKKAPFANIATILFERANNKVLALLYPSLDISSQIKREREHLYQPIKNNNKEMEGPSEYWEHLAAICDDLQIDLDLSLKIQRWGKCVLPGDTTLKSRISEKAGQVSRSSKYFEAIKQGELLFGEALAFYSLPDYNHSVVIYHPLEQMNIIFKRWCGQWSNSIVVLETSKITKLVGIVEGKQYVHILRKHVGLSLLKAEDYGLENEIEEDEN